MSGARKFALLVLAGVAGRTALQRSRAGKLAAVPPAEAPVSTQGWCAVTAPGVRLDEATLRAAIAYADGQRLRALDLIPADLPAAAALDLLDEVDPGAYRRDRTAAARTAGHAMVIREDLARRVGMTDADDPVAFLRLAQRLKECAPTEVDLAVAPGLAAVAADPAWTAARLRTLGIPVPVALAWQPASFGVLSAVTVRTPALGALAGLLLWLRPALVFSPKSPVRPPERVNRPAVRHWWRAVAARGRRSPHEPVKPDLATLRREYSEAVADGLDLFFEPRRDDCPWCGSPALVVQAEMADMLQGKPGRFTLERCRGCGHVFQNPRLSLEGLDYYYRDFYDGLGETGITLSLGQMYEAFQARAELVGSFATPKAWLDVGSGPGHFCLYAREVLPDTVFDGLDMSEVVCGGERDGWLDTAHVGQFPELAGSLAGRYDVISMHHYLEHTRDPRAELAAAARALAPGGHLLIEVPDPQSRLRHVFRSRWLCWFQPQHQHFVPPGNLRAALAEHGFTVVADEHGAAHSGGEFAGFVASLLVSFAPNPQRPWQPGPTAARRLRRVIGMTAAVPLFAAAVQLDRATGWAVRRTDGGNAYRVLARREGPC